MSEYIFGCHNQGSATGIYWVEVRNANWHPVMHTISPVTKSHQIKSIKVEKPQFIYSRTMSHRAQLCARHWARFWKPRNEGHNLCLPEWLPTSKDSEAFLKGQDADHRGIRGTRKTMLSLPGGWREASERRAFSVSIGCWQWLWHWLLDSDFLGSNLDLTTQTSCAFRCYRTSLCLHFLICKTQKIILKMGIGWNIIGKGPKIVSSI